MKKDNISRPLPLRGGGWGVRLHHIKISFRNLWKFKIQTVVCVLGLSVGMACFALGTLWLRYIESFEGFVPDAENTYLASTGRNDHSADFAYTSLNEMGALLRDSVPEIMDVAFFEDLWYSPAGDVAIADRSGDEITARDGKMHSLKVASVDDGFLRIFGIRPILGNAETLKDGEVIVTKSVAQKIFGTNDVLGRELLIAMHYDNPSKDELEFINSRKKVCHITAVIPDCPLNTQFRYDILLHSPEYVHSFRGSSGMSQGYNFVRLNPHADKSELVGKEHEVYISWDEVSETGHTEKFYSVHKYTLLPIRSLRTEFPTAEIEISTTYVRWFMLLGVLVILCSLVNYIITMVNHLRRRAWEMSLRRVLGASRKTILTMVSTETFLTFLLAAIFGWLLSLAVLPFFREYSGIDMPFSAITFRLVGYLALVIAAGCALSAFVARFVMKKTQANILGARQLKHSSTLLDRAGVILQLALSMGIIFSTSIMLRQVNYLMYTDDVGFAHADMGIVDWVGESVKDKVRQSPLIEEMLEGGYPIFPKLTMGYGYFTADQNVNTIDEATRAEEVPIDSTMMDFYHARLVTGRFPIPGVFKSLGEPLHQRYGYNMRTGEWGYRDVWIYPKECCVNEQMCKDLGLSVENAVGQKIFTSFRSLYHVITGVVKDWYVLGPTIQPAPMVFFSNEDVMAENMAEERRHTNIAFRAKTGRVGELCDSIRAWVEADPDTNPHGIYLKNMEAEYAKYVSSEKLLIKILLAVALCSLFVCVLGAFSLVSLSLTERRKEIAIRKAHGAHISDILQLFLRSHYLSLAIAALVAYPLSYIIMRSWLEHYTKQVGIDWWIIPATFLLISAVVIATISAKIYFAAKEKAARALAG